MREIQSSSYFISNKHHRLVCYCKDCQNFLSNIDRLDRLDQYDGTEIVPVHPADVEFFQCLKQRV